MYTNNFCIIISGPTGVGKTAFVDIIAQLLPAEIINADMGQLYKPLTIGTAKPDWRNQSIPHHLFDIITQPELFTVTAFRDRVVAACNEVWLRKNIPIIVGGSGYYLTALFFPPARHETEIQQGTYKTGRDLWQELNKIDSQRAQKIDAADIYRLKRALDIWHSTGVKPSEYKPEYIPIADYFFIWLTRNRDDLYTRINERTKQMIDEGWIEEVQNLDASWYAFLKTKKIIGYPEIIAYCQGQITKEAMIRAIQKKTRNYAKRQMTFFRMLEKKLKNVPKSGDYKSELQECNLTYESVESYSKLLVKQLNNFLKRRL